MRPGIPRCSRRVSKRAARQGGAYRQIPDVPKFGRDFPYQAFPAAAGIVEQLVRGGLWQADMPGARAVCLPSSRLRLVAEIDMVESRVKSVLGNQFVMRAGFDH